MSKDSLPLKERITILRTASGLSQAELAKEVGLTQAQVSKLESGISKDPTTSVMIALTDFFSISIEALINKDPSQFFRAMEKSVASAKAVGDSKREVSSTNQESLDIGKVMIGYDDNNSEIELPQKYYLDNIVLTGGYNHASALLSKNLITGWKEKNIIWDLNNSYSYLLKKNYKKILLEDLICALLYVYEDKEDDAIKCFTSDNLSNLGFASSLKDVDKDGSYPFNHTLSINLRDHLTKRLHFESNLLDVLMRNNPESLPIPEKEDDLTQYKEIVDSFWSPDTSIVIDASNTLKSPNTFYAGLSVCFALINSIIDFFGEKDFNTLFTLDDYGPLFTGYPELFEMVSYKPDNIGFLLISEKIFFPNTRYLKTRLPKDEKELNCEERVAYSENICKTMLLTSFGSAGMRTGKTCSNLPLMWVNLYEENDYLDEKQFTGYHTEMGVNKNIYGRVEPKED